MYEAGTEVELGGSKQDLKEAIAKEIKTAIMSPKKGTDPITVTLGSENGDHYEAVEGTQGQSSWDRNEVEPISKRSQKLEDFEPRPLKMGKPYPFDRGHKEELLNELAADAPSDDEVVEVKAPKAGVAVKDVPRMDQDTFNQLSRTYAAEIAAETDIPETGAKRMNVKQELAAAAQDYNAGEPLIDVLPTLPTKEPMKAVGHGRKQFVGVVGTKENMQDGFKGWNTYRTGAAPDEENAMMWVQTASDDEVAEYEAQLEDHQTFDIG